MKRYKDAVDLRRALETRLKQQSDRTGTDLGRLRRRVVFDRLAARLAVAHAGIWVLKGGTVLEFRLSDRARATKDLDLAYRAEGHDGAELRDVLIETLGCDSDGDHFGFRIGAPTALAADTAGHPAWRFSVEAWLAGKLFAGIRLDVAARGDEIVATERLPLPGVLAFAGIPNREIEAVTAQQQFAEKLHALTRDYGVRPNTRVKDLVDLVLLMEDGLRADHSLVAVVRHVFNVRDTHMVPANIPDPPPAWEAQYPQLAEELTVKASDLPAALRLLRAFWSQALTDETEMDW